MASSVTSVIGPTPPGTGETASAHPATDSVSTSPTIRTLPVTSSLSGLMPTSIIVAPGFTISPVTSRGTPAATTRMSASRVSFSSRPACAV